MYAFTCATAPMMHQPAILHRTHSLCFRDEWKGSVPPYVPRFYDGWQPAPTLVDEVAPRPSIESAMMSHQEQLRNRPQESDYGDYV